MSREKWRDGSSSMSLWSATEILSSSPLDFGSIAKAIAGSGIDGGAKTKGFSFRERESPVSVSLSFATPPMSPAGISGTFCIALPRGEKTCPKRSSVSRVGFEYVPSLLNVPETTRKSVRRPAEGSEIVLKTNAAGGPDGSAARASLAPALLRATAWEEAAPGGGWAVSSGAEG